MYYSIHPHPTAHTAHTRTHRTHALTTPVNVQDYTFYDLIVTKAKGKSGPLWNWDVHDDIRMLADATKEKDESHAAKVVERRWYERNKHIFPASRWEVYDPNVKRDRYTIHGDEVTNK
jgi:hypothetical protein